MKPASHDSPSVCGDSACIIDAPALMAYLEGTPKGQVVQRLLEQAHASGAKVSITALDMVHVYHKGLAQHPDCFAELLALLDQLPLQVEPVTQEGALEAARLMSEHQGLEPGTSLCVYLAKVSGRTLITADPSVDNLGLLPSGQIVYVGNGGQE